MILKDILANYDSVVIEWRCTAPDHLVKDLKEDSLFVGICVWDGESITSLDGDDDDYPLYCEIIRFEESNQVLTVVEQVEWYEGEE